MPGFGRKAKLAPEFALSYVDRASVYERMQELEKALEDYNKALELIEEEDDKKEILEKIENLSFK